MAALVDELERRELRQPPIPAANNAAAITAIVGALAPLGGGALDPSAVETACASLLQLSAHLDNQILFYHAGGVPILVEALRLQLDTEPATLIAHICLAIGGVTDRNADNKSAVRRAGGISLLVATLARFGDNPSVLEAACGALNGATGAAFFVSCDAMVQAGGAAAVLAVMRCHAQPATLVTQSCVALSNITISAPGSALVVLAGGIPLLLAAINAHVEEPAVVGPACRALSNLVQHDGSRSLHISAAGGVPVLLRAYRCHLDGDAECAAKCTQLLDRLSDHRGIRNELRVAGYETTNLVVRVWRGLLWLLGGDRDERGGVWL